MPENVFVLLFRGINVGGNKIVRMGDLRTALTEGGFANVATYIQSGNVVLTSKHDAPASASRVEKIFAETFGFTSRPTIRSLSNWRRLVEENPFPEAVEDGRKVHAVLLDDEPSPEAINGLRALAVTERIEVRNDTLYLHTPDGFGNSKVAESLDKLLKVPLTARNWNSVVKLLQMAEDAQAQQDASA